MPLKTTEINKVVNKRYLSCLNNGEYEECLKLINDYDRDPALLDKYGNSILHRMVVQIPNFRNKDDNEKNIFEIMAAELKFNLSVSDAKNNFKKLAKKLGINFENRRHETPLEYLMNNSNFSSVDACFGRIRSESTYQGFRAEITIYSYD